MDLFRPEDLKPHQLLPGDEGSQQQEDTDISNAYKNYDPNIITLRL